MRRRSAQAADDRQCNGGDDDQHAYQHEGRQQPGRVHILPSEERRTKKGLPLAASSLPVIEDILLPAKHLLPYDKGVLLRGRGAPPPTGKNEQDRGMEMRGSALARGGLLARGADLLRGALRRRLLR